ncbi:hypothetical protein LGN30_32165 [Burkholderia seminalis]|uniref:hypothetical protein n=1 Tax=Burkholderia seminalis TaxID=488731 RepID=UPI001CF1717D|nr:hypothetical protein [Burkholderia seminalis]MCA8427845.1 hypothetical protein [Burkholderia seminalis]
MSDINAAPSSTEPAAISAETTGISTGGNAGENPAISSASTEAGTTAVGELGSTLEPDSSTSATSTGLQSIGASSDTRSGENSNNASVQSTGVPSSDSSVSASLSSESPLPAAASLDSGDAPAVAVVGEGPGSAVPATSASNVADSGDAGTEAADDPNAAASPADGQSASDTASSVRVALRDDGTAAVVWIDSDSQAKHALNLESQLANAHAVIADQRAQLVGAQAEAASWRDRYNAAAVAKPHAQSLLQKLEAGEAIVLGDLHSRLRAFVDAL